ncbi:TM2 domain-containing protein [Cellulophaga baltica]|uniref:TM2 domain-containing protein n=1 Tax=Cellulophaga TaxID=104264 RepID=UPI001C067CF8|nr:MULTISPECIES: TM2 domain-containing protein [Cellulophaga]MBU2997783.1 TM2 domain-containing protein [Cellulophaga baltica]MDO6769179.1 TM2 domain-containing protein [Cellulophaga sp. 1_MG-2023]
MSEESNNFENKAEEFSNEAKKTVNEFADGLNKSVSGEENKKVIAGLLGIFFGYLGIHKFILGYTKEGIIQIIASIVTCGGAGIIGFIEGIIYLTKSDEEFYNTYQAGRKPWF